MRMERYISLPAPVRMVLEVLLLILGSAVFLPTWLATQLQPSVQLALGNKRGALDSRIGAVIGGVITLVIGMVLTSTVNTQAASTGAAANIGSFTGAQRPDPSSLHRRYRHGWRRTNRDGRCRLHGRRANEP